MEINVPPENYDLFDHLTYIDMALCDGVDKTPPFYKGKRLAFLLEAAKETLGHIDHAIEELRTDTGNPRTTELLPVLLNLYSIFASAVTNATAPELPLRMKVNCLVGAFARAGDKHKVIEEISWKVAVHDEVEHMRLEASGHAEDKATVKPLIGNALKAANHIRQNPGANAKQIAGKIGTIQAATVRKNYAPKLKEHGFTSEKGPDGGYFPPTPA